MYIGFHVKSPSFFSDFTETQIFLVDFFLKKYSNIKFHKIHPVGAKMFHADGQTVMKLSHFLQF